MSVQSIFSLSLLHSVDHYTLYLKFYRFYHSCLRIDTQNHTHAYSPTTTHRRTCTHTDTHIFIYSSVANSYKAYCKFLQTHTYIFQYADLLFLFYWKQRICPYREARTIQSGFYLSSKFFAETIILSIF